MLELGSGFDYDLTGKENIYLNGAVLGYSKEFLESRYNDILEFSELGEFINTPIRNYSSGMLMRLAFSIATVVNPEILIVDEILSVGDENLKPTFDKILDANPYNSYKLINASIELNYPNIPYDILKQYSTEMKDNRMCHMILRDLVIYHMYRFDVDYTTRAKINSLNLGLTMDKQRYIQGSSQIKR